jgi:hypothetical protein
MPIERRQPGRRLGPVGRGSRFQYAFQHAEHGGSRRKRRRDRPRRLRGTVCGRPMFP